MIERPKKPEAAPQRASNSLLTVIMLLVFGTVGAGTLSMIPTIGPLLVLGGLMFVGMILFHYLVWGRWMTRVVQEEELRREREESDASVS